jgi:hypothetical protein
MRYEVVLRSCFCVLITYHKVLVAKSEWIIIKNQFDITSISNYLIFIY